MPKKILLVDSDAALAADIGAALHARGAELALARDAGSVLELARAERPDAFVLCAELPGGSGFVLCNKLRKEPDLKDIPLLLTSAGATEETFEQHRKLKTRADAYLKKPFAIAALLEKLAPLAGLADAAAPGAPDDDDLLAFDAAFDSIAQVDAASGPIDHPISFDEIDAAAALVADLPDVEEASRSRAASPFPEASPFAGTSPFPEASPFPQMTSPAEATPSTEASAPDETAAELEALRGEVARLRAEDERLRGEVEHLRAEGDRLRTEADGLRAEGDRLRGELSRATAASAEQVTAERARIRAALEAALASLDRS